MPHPTSPAEALLQTGEALYGQACLAENLALRGEFDAARSASTCCWPPLGLAPPTRAWLLTSVAELETRAGRAACRRGRLPCRPRGRPGRVRRLAYADFLLAEPARRRGAGAAARRGAQRSGAAAAGTGGGRARSAPDRERRPNCARASSRPPCGRRRRPRMRASRRCSRSTSSATRSARSRWRGPTSNCSASRSTCCCWRGWRAPRGDDDGAAAGRALGRRSDCAMRASMRCSDRRHAAAARAAGSAALAGTLVLALLAVRAAGAGAQGERRLPAAGAADGGGTALRVDVALRDLDAALDLDADADGRLTWGEVQGGLAGDRRPSAAPCRTRRLRASTVRRRCSSGAPTASTRRCSTARLRAAGRSRSCATRCWPTSTPRTAGCW